MKKSILFVNGHLNVGGVEKALVDLLSSIDYDRYDVDLLLLEGDGDYRDQIPLSVRVLHRDLRSIEGPFWRSTLENMRRFRFGNICYRLIQVIAKKYGKSWLSLLKHLLPIRKYYDIAIAFRTGYYADIVTYAVSAGKKYCWWHDGEAPDSQQKHDDLANQLLPFDRIVAVSEGCKSFLCELFDIPVYKYVVVPNIINQDKLRLMAERGNPYGNDKRYKIVTLCRFEPEKHLIDAVEVAAKLEGLLDYVWYMIGDGSEFERVAKKVKEYNLQSRIILTGRITNPYPFLSNADLMVHPSHAESLCLSVIEAMALGLPCVVVRSIGPESFIDDGINGILIEKGQEALFDGIMKTVSLGDSALDQIRQKAILTVLNDFSPNYVIKQFEKLIDGN